MNGLVRHLEARMHRFTPRAPVAAHGPLHEATTRGAAVDIVATALARDNASEFIHVGIPPADRRETRGWIDELSAFANSHERLTSTDGVFHAPIGPHLLTTMEAAGFSPRAARYILIFARLAPEMSATVLQTECIHELWNNTIIDDTDFSPGAPWQWNSRELITLTRPFTLGEAAHRALRSPPKIAAILDVRMLAHATALRTLEMQMLGAVRRAQDAMMMAHNYFFSDESDESPASALASDPIGDAVLQRRFAAIVRSAREDFFAKSTAYIEYIHSAAVHVTRRVPTTRSGMANPTMTSIDACDNAEQILTTIEQAEHDYGTAATQHHDMEGAPEPERRAARKLFATKSRARSDAITQLAIGIALAKTAILAAQQQSETALHNRAHYVLGHLYLQHAASLPPSERPAPLEHASSAFRAMHTAQIAHESLWMVRQRLGIAMTWLAQHPSESLPAGQLQESARTIAAADTLRAQLAPRDHRAVKLLARAAGAQISQPDEP